MATDGLMAIRYLISAEESRIGRTDYWNSVFLAGRTPFDRTCLALLKVLVIITLSVFMVMALSQL
ncbi:hypothetical protein DSCA_20450 [Desulfosarcina alkanivorans]|uniref:Uncharacterized protein n=1 Tax=Desulfosarcina alkanivorans TaxID=571177 RepID=A0A5K7YIA6_9BACT|nr:hypothetical protein [Desulfosarcina alkanivorans]BBO68115.1 hypothetical protein DSCA_20450 [Desulfosarcina alkanivorans]